MFSKKNILIITAFLLFFFIIISVYVLKLAKIGRFNKQIELSIDLNSKKENTIKIYGMSSQKNNTREFIKKDNLFLSQDGYYKALIIKLTKDEFELVNQITIKIGEKTFSYDKDKINKLWKTVKTESNSIDIQSPDDIYYSLSNIHYFKSTINWSGDFNELKSALFLYIKYFPVIILLIIIYFGLSALFTFKRSVFYIIITFFLFSFLIMPFIAISCFNYPSADDFSNFNSLNIKGYIGSFINSYLNWSGRFTTNFMCFIFLFPNLFVLSKFFPAIITVLFLLFLLFLTNTFFNKSITLTKKFIISIVLTALFYFQMPTISEGIYWLTGNLVYSTSLLWFLLFLIFFIKYWKNTKLLYFIILIFLTIIIVGTNEIMLFIINFILIGNIIFSWKIKNRRYNNIILFIVSVIFSFVSILAPGNYVRMVFFPNSKNIFLSVTGSLVDSCQYIFKWVANLVFIFSTLLVSIFIIEFVKSCRKVNSFIINPILLFGFSFSIFTICFFPHYWGEGNPNVLRAVNSLYFIFLILWFYNIYNFILFYYNHNEKFLKIRKLIIKLKNIKTLTNLKSDHITIIFILIIVLSLSFSKNNISMVYDDFINGKVKIYDNLLKERYMKINEYKNTDQSSFLEVKKIIDSPSTIYVSDITSEEKDWKNIEYAKYFKIKGIRTK